MRTALAIAVSTVVLAATPALAQCEPGEQVLKFSHVVAATGHPKGNAAAALADRINEELNGRVCAEVYANSELYSDDDVLDAIVRGDVAFAAPSLSKFESYTKKFRIFDLPFVFSDIYSVERFQNGPAGQELLRSMVGDGLLGLAYWHNGLKQISANKPLLMPSDAAGLTFRIQSSDVIVAQIEALDAIPRKMAFKDVAAALASGEVDAQQNTWSNIETKGFYLHQDGITESNHAILDYLLVTSSALWSGLPAEVRTDLDRIVAEVTNEYNGYSFELNEISKMKIEADGGVIRTLTEEQRAAWVAAFRPVWDRFGAEIGSEVIRQAISAGEG
jgi:C4-dicarboxylate-binding protein DctP